MKALLILLAFLAAACANSSSGVSNPETPPQPPLSDDKPPGVLKGSPRFEHVIYIVLENTDYSGAISNRVLKDFADQGIQFDQFLAETHPSQGNYIAMIAGDKLGVWDDGNYNISEKEQHLGDLLERNQMDWRVYAEGFPGNCFLGATDGSYARKHVPFLSFLNVTRSPSRCSKVLNASSFQSDWANHRLAHFNMYIPDLNNDGHDTGIGFAAAWFAKTFGSALTDPRLMEKTLVVVTFDESEGYFGANKIYTAMSSPNLPSKLRIKGKHSHSSLLKFIEDEWNIGNLGRSDRTAAAIQELRAK